MNYRQKYDNTPIDTCYRAFVDGNGSLRQLAKMHGASVRTLAKYSSQDTWMAEKEERQKRLNEDLATTVARLATEAATPVAALPEPTDRAQLADPESRWARVENPIKRAILRVMARQQIAADRLDAALEEAWLEMVAKAHTDGKKLRLGQIFPFLKAWEIVQAMQRKAYGIPDVSRLELDDKRTPAEAHVAAIRERRMERERQTIDTVAKAIEEAS